MGLGTKAAATVGPSDSRGLRKVRAGERDRLTSGVVLFDGEMSVPVGEMLKALPLGAPVGRKLVLPKPNHL